MSATLHNQEYSNPDRHHYDVVIIGSGLGGLLCAVMLAKEGMKVCVLEKNKQIGGCLQTFSLHKTVFDSCVHYVGGLGEGHTLHRIFSYAGIMSMLKLFSFDPDGFDRIAFGNEEISYPQAVGKENFIAQLVSHFPDQQSNLRHYVESLQHVGDHFPLYRLRNGDALEKSKVAHWEILKTLQSISPNKRLQQILVGNNLLYAGVPHKTPFYLHALVLESYIHSAHKLVPGSSQIAKLLWRELQAHGGVVFRHAHVSGLIEEKGLIQYAETQHGQRFYAKQFISDIHPQALLFILKSKLVRSAYRKRIEGLEQSTSAFMLNLVLRPHCVPMRYHNLYWHATDNVWSATTVDSTLWPHQYALYFTEDQRYPGFAESLSVLTYMPFAEVSSWTNTHNHSGNPNVRCAEYEDFKAEKAEILLNKVLERFSDLKGNILAQSAATPLTYRDYGNNPEGSLYGILKDVSKPAETQISVKTKIPNLLQTGQNVNLHGVLGVSITAVATCAEMLGMDYVLKKM
ncbi:MAG: NAD(P)/FAD-dependent oxidoreductase [Bacteroidetes bacterium]|nr:NAD(P)/FAD-dependent oxidoreductase [Bacteroidota bacterium]